jgi:hypothetical protein
MAKYIVEVWEEMGGYLTIEANSVEEAEEKAEQHLADYGVNAANGIDCKVTHRDTYKQGSKVVN